jgi:hypothetical protein
MSTINHINARPSSFRIVGTRAMLTALIVCLASASLAQDETGIIDKSTEAVSKGADVVVTKSEEAWDATKQGAGVVADKSGEVWDETKEIAGEAWDATKSTSKKAAEYTVEKSAQAWDATKEGTQKAVDYSEETYERVKESLASENEADVPVEDKSFE